MELSLREEETKAGMKYNYQLKMQVPKDRVDVERILFQLNNRHLIINVIDKNGVSRFFGTMESPMKKTGKLLKPSNIESYHGWEVVFTGEFSQPASYASVGSGIPLPMPDALE
ncbi:MAG: hypothetical protein NTW16_01360 [Bacteroidetes bacterium]|nr:hypothetical protein [Bacteroidota bacterium]